MQTTTPNEPTAHVAQPDHIETQAAAAQANIAKLERDASEKDAIAEAARVTFEREPSGKAHADHAVATQRAKNAHAALEAYREQTRPTLEAAEHARNVAELTVLRPMMDARALTSADVAVLANALVELEHTSRTILDRIYDKLSDRNGKIQRAESLERSVGEPHRCYPRATVQQVLSLLRDELVSRGLDAGIDIADLGNTSKLTVSVRGMDWRSVG